MTILVCNDTRNADVLAAATGQAHVVGNVADLRRRLADQPDDLVVMGPDVDLIAAAEFAAAARIERPTLGVVLVRHRVDTGVLTQALRAGIREVVPAQETQRLGEACAASRTLSAELRQAAGVAPATAARRGRVVTVFSGKGGAGKTTVAVNLGVALAQSGARTCLMDLDLAFGDVGVLLGLFPERTLSDAVPMAATLDAAGAASLATVHESGLHAVLAPTEPSAAEHVHAALVARLIPLFAEQYDVVVVDTPPAFTEHMLTAVDASDELVLVTTPDVTSIKNLKLAMHTLDLLSYPAERRRIVLNRAEAHTQLTPDDVASMIEAPVRTVVPADCVVTASINRGVPVVLDQPRHAVTRAIRQLAAAVGPDHRPPVADGPTTRRRGARLRRRESVL